MHVGAQCLFTADQLPLILYTFPPWVALLTYITVHLQGIDAWTLLRHGLPPYFQDFMFTAFGAWDTTLWTLALTAAAAPAAAWAFRAWWVSSVLLLSAPGGAVQQLHQAIQGQQQQEPAGEQQQQQDAAGASWLAGLLTVVRGFCFAAAISGISSALLSSSMTSTLVSSAAALAAVVVAATPVALSLSAKQSTAASLLAADAAYVVAMVGLAPIANAAAAVILAASLWTLHQQLVMPRLMTFKASEGDAVEVHVSLKVAGTEAVFDSTLTADPLKLVAAQQDPEFLQAWKQLSLNGMWEQSSSSSSADQDTQQQQQQQQPDTAGSSSDFAVTGSVRDIAENIQSWMSDPEARWESLQPFAAEAACGLFLGETRSVRFFNPKGVGYWNPRFSWWQPKSDVAEKFKGQMPNPGDVFWYPVSESAYVQTRVTSIGDTHVELDANYGVTGTELQMVVQLVRLQKQ